MPKATSGTSDPFFRLQSAFRNEEEDALHAGLVRPVFSRCERVRPKKDFLFHLHQHHDFEIIFVIRGPYDYVHNKERFTLPENTVLIVEPGDWHQDHCRPPLDYAAILCTLRGRGDGELLPGLRFFRREVPLEQRYTTFQASMFLPLLEKMAQEAETQDAFAAHLLDTLLEELFWRLARSFDPALLAPWLAPSPSNEQFLARFSAVMERLSHRSVAVPELARFLGMSQRSLSMRCASLLGDSPARLFTRYKMEKAKRLLAETDISVKEVSDRFGFANPFHFSRAFKAITGHPPSSRSGAAAP